MSKVIDITTAPALPVKNTVLYPYLITPLSVGRPGSIAAVEAALSSEDKILAVFTQKEPSVEKPGAADLYDIGCLAVMKRMARGEEGFQIVVQGTERVELIEVEQEQPYLKARVQRAPVADEADAETQALHRAVLDLAKKMQELVQPQVQMGLGHIISEVKEPLHQIYLLASLLSLDTDKEIALLKASTRREATRLVYDHLNYEVQVLELRNKIASQAESEMSREQREYMLRQQLRAIQEELGERSPEQSDVSELRNKMEEADLPELVRKEVERELSRLERLPSSAPDYQLTRTYIELAIELPWKKATEDNLDLERARSVLDADHFDLEEVKDRIIEHLAVMKLNPGAKAPILCFVGPPGVGKTSLGQSIARSLERRFERMSLGGLHDEAELRGDRKSVV